MDSKHVPVEPDTHEKEPELNQAPPKEEEKKTQKCLRVLNYKRDKHDLRDLKFKLHFNAVNTLPPSFSLRSVIELIPYDQLSIGSCTSNSSCKALEFYIQKEVKKGVSVPFTDPSRLFQYYNERLIDGDVDNDSGSSNRTACKSIQLYSVCSEKTWPYDVSKFKDKPPQECYTEAHTHFKNFKYYAVNQSTNAIKTALVSGFPIIIGIEVYASFFSDEVEKTGLVPVPDTTTEEYEGGHSVLMLGYDEQTQMFECINSWGSQWGKQGYFYLPYKFVLNKNLTCDFWAFTLFN